MRRLRLGIVTDEHLGLAESRKGGFGWASQQVGRFFLENPLHGVDPLIINCERTHGRTDLPRDIEGVPVIWRAGSPLPHVSAGANLAPDPGVQQPLPQIRAGDDLGLEKTTFLSPVVALDRSRWDLSCV